MQTTNVVMDRVQARDLYRKYKEHKHYSTPIDREVQRAYQLIAQGRLVIRALESIKLAGLGADTFPKLAIAPANVTHVECEMFGNGGMVLDARAPGARYQSSNWERMIAQRSWINFPAGTFPGRKMTDFATAQLPIVPLIHRPARGLANYHILFEAEWTKIPPRDPMLLRRIGRADLWVVLAMWDLTDVERAALSTRV